MTQAAGKNKNSQLCPCFVTDHILPLCHRSRPWLTGSYGAEMHGARSSWYVSRMLIGYVCFITECFKFL